MTGRLTWPPMIIGIAGSCGRSVIDGIEGPFTELLRLAGVWRVSREAESERLVLYPLRSDGSMISGSTNECKLCFQAFRSLLRMEGTDRFARKERGSYGGRRVEHQHTHQAVFVAVLITKDLNTLRPSISIRLPTILMGSHVYVRGPLKPWAGMEYIGGRTR